MAGLKQLIQEVHRRSLWQVLLIYIAAGWVVFEIVQTVTEGLGLPTWFPAFAALLLLIGLPIVLATAFVQEGGPPLGRTDPTLLPGAEVQSEARPREVAGARRLFTWRNAITGGVLALALWGVVATGWYVVYGGAAAELSNESKSVAVLPLANMSANPDDQYFTDGIHDAIIEHLAKIGDLKVISRTSVMEYRNTTKNIRQIAEELGVATLLEGGVQRVGDLVKITVQLIAARADEHLWVESYERELTAQNVFAIQSDVAQQIAAALKATLTPAERERIDKQPTENVEAYDYYLRGNDYARRYLAREDAQTAARMYARAVELDPNFAVAYAALARARVWLTWHFGRSAELPKAKAALDKARQLAPDLPETHMALGDYYYYGSRDYESALEQYVMVRGRQPSHAEAIASIGWIRRRQGRWEEALGNVEKALELDPRNWFWTDGQGVTYVFLRRYPEAERYFDRAIPLASDNPRSYAWKVYTYLGWDGGLERARRVLQEASRRIEAERVLLATFHVWGSLFVRIFAEDYAAALDRLTLERPGIDTVPYFFAKAELATRRTQIRLARAYYDSARVVLEARVEEKSEAFAPGDQQVSEYRTLGVVYARLGRVGESIRLGEKAVALTPVSKYPFGGPAEVQALAEIYVIAGEYDAAIDKLEYLLSIPSWISVGLLRVDPLWDPLRDHPRFQALLEKYGKPSNGGAR